MIAALLLAGALQVAHAADWLSIQGLEPAEPEAAALRPIGFLQVAAEGILAEPVEGLTSETLAPYEGQVASFNRFATRGDAWALTLRRVRVGGRGALPGPEGRLNGQIAVELGRNALTTTAADGWRPALMDASVTWVGRHDVHVRVGQFKLPLSEEALEAVHVTNDLIQFNRATSTLLMERSAATGAFEGRVNGFRGAGVEVFGGHGSGDVAFTWAAMASRGWTGAPSLDPGWTWTGRAQLARILGGAPRSPEREELSAWVFASTGMRAVGPDAEARRTRAGVGAQLNTARLRLRAEGLVASGVLNVGMAPPFPGGTLQVDPAGQAWGATALVSWHVVPRWEVGAAGSHLDSRPRGGPDRRLFDDVTGVVQLHLTPKARLDLNASWRLGRAPEGSADARAILDTMGPYGGVMFTARL
ncbi:MAG: hypothetical protein H6739_24790 [Alphaproteobacteria bacterium]|nr:hypothetical protein [Alphaproteobacteria bacterium]